MNLVSDEILIDSGQESPTHEAAYRTIEGFKLWDPDAWTNGHPFELYKRMREESPVMWLPGERRMSGFWSVTRYEDIKRLNLHIAFFLLNAAALISPFLTENIGDRRNSFQLR